MPSRPNAAQRRISSLLAVSALLASAGCDAVRVVNAYPAPESAMVEDAPWPRLVDTPTPETARAAAPDPATGARIAEALTVEAAIARAETERLSPPVFDIETLEADAASVRREGAARERRLSALGDAARAR